MPALSDWKQINNAFLLWVQGFEGLSVTPALNDDTN